ncbi:MAG: sigma 54-interacting transcriptional regulator [Desulfovermiculus sp.]
MAARTGQSALPAVVRWSRIWVLLIASLFLFSIQAFASQTVRVGLYEYRPFLFINDQGQVDGLYAQVLEHIAKQENWQLKYIQGSWLESLSRLENASIDILPAIAYSQERAERFDFTRETFLTNWGVLFAHKPDQFASITDLQGKRIALYEQGIFSQALTQMVQDFQIACTFVRVQDYDMVFELIASGKVDAGVANHIIGTQYSSKSNVHKTAIIFMPTELKFALPQGHSSEIKELLDQHLGQLKADSSSVYYNALDRWSIHRWAAKSADRSFPAWLRYGLLAAFAAAAILLSTSLLLKVQVKRKTSELNTANKELEAEIAERKQTEADLRANEARLSRLMGNLPGLVYRLGSQNPARVEFISQGSLKLLGFSPQRLYQIKGPGFAELIHPEDTAAVTARLEQVQREGRAYQILYRLRTSSGDYKWVCDHGTPIVSEQGSTGALEGFITEITSSQEAKLRLQRENEQLRSTMQDRYRLVDIVGNSQAIQQVYALIHKAAASCDSVIICGESGTGKELAARAIHSLSSRGINRFVPVNCAAIPESLMESEFFGHARGAFTGADADKTGYLELADKGTLFLDEIGDIRLDMQVKLLRALEGGGFNPVGSTELKKPDLRIIGATNKDLKELVRKGHMREDLYYRINIIPIELPPLRKRKEDIPLLVDHFLRRHYPEDQHTISPTAMEALRSHQWPGNVRELQNAIIRYITLGSLDLETKPANIQLTEQTELLSGRIVDLETALKNFEKTYLSQVLAAFDWHRGHASQALGINRKTLFKKIKAYSLDKAGENSDLQER